MAKEDYAPLVAQYEQAYGVPRGLGHAVMVAESGGDPSAISSAGAIGPMQLLGSTAKELGVDPYDPHANIEGGIRYLGNLLKKYKGSVPDALSAYNSGKPFAQGANFPGVREYVRTVMANTPNQSQNQLPGNLTNTPQQVNPFAQFAAMMQSGGFGGYGGLMPGMSTYTDPTLMAEFLKRVGHTSSVPIYDPFAPTQVPNPAYNPAPRQAPSSIDPFGTFAQPQPAMGSRYDERPTLQGPSDIQQRETAEKTAAEAQISPFQKEADRLKANAALLEAQQKVLEANPPPQMQAAPDIAMPMREVQPVPTHPQPTLDPMSAIFSAIAGVADPRGAGLYATQPFQSAVDVSDQLYKDKIMRYAEMARQLNQKYEDELTKRNEALRASRENREIAYENLSAKQKQALAGGNLGALVTDAMNQAGIQEGYIDKDKRAQLAGLVADQMGRRMSEKERLNAAEILQDTKAQQQENLLLRSALNAGPQVLRTVLNAGNAAQSNQNQADRNAALAAHEQREDAIKKQEVAIAQQHLQIAQQNANTARMAMQNAQFSKLSPQQQASIREIAKANDQQVVAAKEYAEVLKTQETSSPAAKTARRTLEAANANASRAQAKHDALFAQTNPPAGGGGGTAAPPAGRPRAGTSKGGNPWMLR